EVTRARHIGSSRIRLEPLQRLSPSPQLLPGSEQCKANILSALGADPCLLAAPGLSTPSEPARAGPRGVRPELSKPSSTRCRDRRLRTGAGRSPGSRLSGRAHYESGVSPAENG